MRRYGDPVDPRRRYRDRPGAYAVIREGDDVLVTEQDAPEREFQLPGGGLDPDEGMLHALHRECLEETGWRIRVLRRLGAYQRFAYMPDYDLWARKVCHIYLAHPVRRLGEPAEPGHSAIWMPDPDCAGAPRGRGRPGVPRPGLAVRRLRGRAESLDSRSNPGYAKDYGDLRLLESGWKVAGKWLATF